MPIQAKIDVVKLWRYLVGTLEATFIAQMQWTRKLVRMFTSLREISDDFEFG